MHYELPIGAFFAAALALVPLPWHWRARNVATISIIAWLFISNVIYGTNSIIWAGNVEDVVPIWCDIATKLQVGSTISLPACCLCLCIHLERIASVRNSNNTHQDKRRRMIFDAIMCWGIPIIYMALHYVVQGHRYDIVEDFGCRPAVFNSVQSILLFWLPPLILVVLTIIYAALSLHHFFTRRITFARHLHDKNPALTISRYFRLIAMAIVQMFWGAFVIGFNMWFTCRTGLRKWISWDDVHSNFLRVGQFPTVFIPQPVVQVTYFTWWTIPASSVLFFIFFAFGQDAVKEYVACIRWVVRHPFRRSEKTKVSNWTDKPKSSPRFPPRLTLPSFPNTPSDFSKSFADDLTIANQDEESLKKPSSPLSTTESFSFSNRTSVLSTDMSCPTLSVPSHYQGAMV